VIFLIVYCGEICACLLEKALIEINTTFLWAILLICYKETNDWAGSFNNQISRGKRDLSLFVMCRQFSDFPFGTM